MIGKKPNDSIKEDTWEKIEMLPTPKDDLLYDYQKKAMDTLYDQYFSKNLCKEVTIPSTYTPPPVSYKPTNVNLTNQSNVPSTTLTAKDLQDLIKHLNVPSSKSVWPYGYGDYDTYFKPAPMVGKHEKKVEVTLDDGSVESISREELIKYIGERKIIQENEVVRKVYERYQVAVKLVRSDDNGDTGV